ncbi:MAG: redox-regulated ATPase YchF [Anaerolineae bacterium]|nr:redox-regulated ATPase YchF [Anaerolineae bacterium]
MKLGIIGLPGSGKTTIFNALTRGDAPVGQSVSGRFDVLTSVVDVPDLRVDVLTGMFKPQKTAYAKVIYTDIAGLKKGIGESGGMSGPLLNHLAALDGFVHVVRAFDNDQVLHLEDTIDPARDLATLDTEFLLADMMAVEARLTRLREGMNKSKDKVAAQREIALLERLHEKLSEERPLREVDLAEEEEKSLRGFGFLTLKPVLVLINIGDEQAEIDLPYDFARSKVVNLRGRLEAELAQMSGDDLELFMAEYGVTELGLARVIHESYDLMGLHSFFTVGEDEVRAWTLARGGTAVDAAATIHTDLAKGFIRAEVVAYPDLIAAGGLSQARAVGKLRQEGKTYIVHDGDIVHIKFNL